MKLITAVSGLCMLASTAIALSNNTTSTHSVAGQNATIYKPLFQKYSPDTPVFINVTGKTANPLVKALLISDSTGIEKRQTTSLPIGACAPGTPCVNGACCSNTGVCSYAPSSCAAENCISNCNATAPCGEYAEPSVAHCPLNVCCSAFGFCGTTSDFCTTTGPNPCQAGYGACGAVTEPSCEGNSASGRIIGYYESWSSTRVCDTRFPEDLDLSGVTHINFAFAFFHPTTFEITPMDPGDPALYKRFTDLKKKKASLETWISVGGWSFNDPTNSPNTRTAFSDMVSTSANRQAFISSLTQFMRTYSFDGVDFDWEYPAASDRGGVAADTANYVTLLEELRAAFGTNYGISATIPSSYWYLQGFDIGAMQNSLDWFNFMSYDIHGVWDSTDKFAGPYILPHTNLTEIREGLDLLWLNDVAPNQVTLGLGWYGRSFTLTDPSCSTPNGVCQFSAGGNAGQCTQSAGTLSNAEINRIIAAGGATENFDPVAAIKWITWDSNQWVSFDDGETIQLKIQAANNLCLGGVMIWSLDQDDTASSSLDDLLGIGTANGVSAAEAASIREQMSNATLAADVAGSCYWTLCAEDCTTGYFPETQATGQVAGIQAATVCEDGDFQTLCCAPGTTTGQCQWEGWRGVGLPCAAQCNDTSDTIIARNTNHYYNVPTANIYEDQTCNGGYQAYCCSGFIPSQKTNTGNLLLIGQTDNISKRSLSRRASVKGGATGAAIGIAACAALLTVANIVAAIFSFGLSTLGAPAEYAACIAAAGAIGYIASGSGGSTQSNPKPPPVPASRNTGTPVQPIHTYGQWELLTFGGASPGTTACDCEVTYTCRYGVGTAGGFDEVCDNQHWAIDKGLGGANVYNIYGRGATKSYSMTDWKKQHTSWQALAQSNIGGVARCQVDEFPMGVLQEARKPNKQICRLVNGPANGRQGVDFNQWSRAVYAPCSTYRKDICKSNDGGPPVTWAIGQPPPGDNRLVAQSVGSHFIGKYGFDSQTAGSICFATAGIGLGAISTVSDHGFRALNNDPMFTNVAYAWPLQDYKGNPNKKGAVLPTNVASANWQKRQIVQSVLAKNLSETALHENGEDSVDCNTCDILIDDETGEVIYLDDSGIMDSLVPAEQVITSIMPVVCPTAVVEVSRAGARVQHDGPVETAPTVFVARGGSRNAALQGKN